MMNDTITIIDKQTGQEIEIPEKGSVGLLALGHIGLRAWRKVRAAGKNEKSTKNENEA